MAGALSIRPFKSRVKFRCPSINQRSSFEHMQAGSGQHQQPMTCLNANERQTYSQYPSVAIYQPTRLTLFSHRTSRAAWDGGRQRPRDAGFRLLLLLHREGLYVVGFECVCVCACERVFVHGDGLIDHILQNTSTSIEADVSQQT